MQKENVSILVISCDKNEWLLDIFFSFFNKYWSNCKYPIYVSMEKRSYTTDKMKIQVINDYQRGGWSGRVKRALEKIKEDYVIVMLDDFLMEQAVNEELLNDYINLLESNSLYNVILTPVLKMGDVPCSEYANLNKRAKYGRYKTCLQCGLWDKKILQKLLKDKESPWEFEIFGNIRSFVYENKFYVVKGKEYKPIDYNDGFFVVQGMVNLPEKVRIEKKTSVEIPIGDVPTFENNMVRDNIRLFPRIIRRIRIIIYYCWYRVKVLAKNMRK